MDNLYNIKTKFSELFGKQPRVFRAPGRINLIGEHTDYNDGFVMPAAIDKEVIFALERADRESIAYSWDMQQSFTVDLNKITPSNETPWANYLLGILASLQQKGLWVGPFNLVFGGNIPMGAGLSSSAAMECGFITGLNALFELGLSKIEMAEMSQWAEHNYAGVKCGIMDQFASMMGKKDYVFRLDCRSLQHEYFPLQLGSYTLLLLDTNVKHALASSEYNTRRWECEQGVDILKSHQDDILNLRDVSSSMVRKHKDVLPGKVYDRCLYVTEEIERVIAASKDLEKGDLVAFGKKMYETHDGLSSLYEVSCKELDYLVNKVKTNPHVLGARMMGGGFGGCTINIVKKDVVEELASELKAEYQKKFGIALKVYPVSLRDGAGEI